MITVYLTMAGTTTSSSFNTLTSALEYARSQEIGASFKIKEGNTLLAKGTIEDLKDDFYA
jgi:hypothetical protein